jgi:hypothetical protein
VLYPPVGVAHISSTLEKYTETLPGQTPPDRLIVSTSAQPNSHPHLGSVTTILSAFSLAARLHHRWGLDTELLFDSLDNAPARTAESSIEMGGVRFQRSLEHTTRAGGTTSLADHYMETFSLVLDWASARSGIEWRRRRYSDFQQSPAVRARTRTMALSHELFGAIVNRDHRALHLRAPCPTCFLMDKDYVVTSLQFSDLGIQIQSTCPEHGGYTVPVSNEPAGYIDINTPLRDITKCAEFADWRKAGTLVVMVDGNDWGGSWISEIVVRALAHMDEDLRQLPVRLFAPLITDNTGAKLSKSIYVASGAYHDMPKWVSDISMLSTDALDPNLERLWRIVDGWTAESRTFFRNYSIDAMIGGW